MAAAALSLFLIVSLLSLSTTNIAATFINPLTIPSCTGHPSMLKCAHDVEAAIVSTSSAQIGVGAHTIPLLLDSISVAKASYVNVLHFLSSKHIKSDISMSIQLAVNIAMQELDQALKVVHGKKMLSSSELHAVEGFLKIANQKVDKVDSLFEASERQHELITAYLDRSVHQAHCTLTSDFCTIEWQSLRRINSLTN